MNECTSQIGYFSLESKSQNGTFQEGKCRNKSNCDKIKEAFFD